MASEELKRHCLARLNERAMEHPSGHQGQLAARFLLKRSDGDVVELMFEKGPKSPPNLWVANNRVGGLIEQSGLQFRLSPASILFTKKGSNGKPLYGRHSALKPMQELGHSDLVCFRIIFGGVRISCWSTTREEAALRVFAANLRGPLQSECAERARPRSQSPMSRRSRSRSCLLMPS